MIGTERDLGRRVGAGLMDGIHDLGGRQGYGPIDVDEPPEPFHAPWEARVLGIVRAFTRPADWSIDWFRHVRECIEPADYLTRPYYDQWLQTYAAMMIDSGAATVEELSTGKSATRDLRHAAADAAARRSRRRRGMARFDRESNAVPAFAAGDAVTTRSLGVPRPHPAARNMRAAGPAGSRPSTASTSSPTPTWPATVRPSRSTRSRSSPPISGRRRRAGRTASISTSGRAILSAPEAGWISRASAAAGAPVFAEPWHAEVLALAFALVERGTFSPAAWSEALGAELRRAQARGEPDDQETYYAAALAALEHLVASSGSLTAGALSARVEAWRRAYLATPHGRPVELAAAGDPHR